MRGGEQHPGLSGNARHTDICGSDLFIAEYESGSFAMFIGTLMDDSQGDIATGSRDAIDIWFSKGSGSGGVGVNGYGYTGRGFKGKAMAGPPWTVSVSAECRYIGVR